MRWDFVRFVAWKELLSTFRDKRTLTTTILLPLLLPLLGVIAAGFIGKAIGGEQQTRQAVGVIGLERMPVTLRKALEDDTKFSVGVRLKAVKDATASVREGLFDAVIVVPEKVPSIAGGAPVPIKIYFKQSNKKAELVFGKISSAVQTYATELTQQKLKDVGLSENVLKPVIATPVDVDTAAESASGAIASFIPYLLFTFLVMAAQATAIDATAGEKERGTLEALIVTPVSRLEVVVGKILSVLFFACLGAVFSVLGVLLAGLVTISVLPLILGKSVSDGAGMALFSQGLVFSPVGLLAVLAVLITFALAISSLLLTVCIFARSFKEAQTYLSPIVLVVILPLSVLNFASDYVTRGVGLYAIPVIGSAVAIIDVLKGNYAWVNILTALGMNLVLSAVLIAFAFSSFKREQVLFRN
jgi:sodium transport system permease protein